MARMARAAGHKNGLARVVPPSKYDANNTVLDKTYGAFADLRRELNDSKNAVAERAELLNHFSNCTDPQRAWLFLEDYFERLRLSRKDFGAREWWPRLLSSSGKVRLEETALLFMRSGRPVPAELTPYANYGRLAEIVQAEQDEVVVSELENWLAPKQVTVLDGPRAALRVIGRVEAVDGQPGLHRLMIEFVVSRLRTGEKIKGLPEMLELHEHAVIEEKQFSPEDWEFIHWLGVSYRDAKKVPQKLHFDGAMLLTWLARWGARRRLEVADASDHFTFHGEIAELTPHLEVMDAELTLTNHFLLPNGTTRQFRDGRIIEGLPALVLLENRFYVLRHAPPASLVTKWTENPVIPVRKLSHRLLTHLRRNGHPRAGDWEQLCVAHKATPQFTFELADETIRLRLLARSERDQSVWQWDGHEWQPTDKRKRNSEKPEVLDDARLAPAAAWLRRLGRVTPAAG